MSLSFGPFLACFIITAFLTLYLHFIIYHPHYFFDSKLTKIFAIGICIIFIRMIIPINLPFTYTIYSYNYLPELLDFATHPVLNTNIRIDLILLIVWFTVAIFLLLRLMYHYHRIKQYLSLYYVSDTDSCRQLKTHLHPYYKKSIEIAMIPQTVSPSVTGFFHPIIILPDNNCYNDKERFYICIHEITHYTRHHLWLSLLMEIVCRIHWWNPFVHLMKKDFSLFLELSNDSFLIRNIPGFNTIDYADIVLKTAKTTQNNKKSIPGSLLCFSLDSATSLKTRIHFILDNQEKQFMHKAIAFLCACIISISMLLSVFVVPEANFETFIPNDETMGYSISADNAYIINTGSTYQIYVDGNFFVELDEIPEDFKNLPIYKEDVEGEN